MKRDGWAFGLSGVLFGVLVGWILGTQRQAPAATPAAPAQAAAPAAPNGPPPLDTRRAADLEQQAQANPADFKVREDLGNLYFDARQWPIAQTWYEAALKLSPRDVNVSTDLAVCYFYQDDPTKALQQVEYSLSLDPRHLKTLLNQGIIRKYGKNDSAGAAESWQKVVQIAPASEEARIAQQGLDGLRDGHARSGDAKSGGSERP